MAREFDQLWAEDGRSWPATDFVRWLADDYRASAEVGEAEPQGRRQAA